MIFLTVGTERFPFDRLIKAVDELAAEKNLDVFMQIGTAAYTPKNSKWDRFLSFEKMKEKILDATQIISHAGAGSIIFTLQLGKLPVIVPRLKKFGEHIDDHQLGLATQLHKINALPVFFEIDDFKKNFFKLDIKHSASKAREQPIAKFLNDIMSQI